MILLKGNVGPGGKFQGEIISNAPVPHRLSRPGAAVANPELFEAAPQPPPSTGSMLQAAEVSPNKGFGGRGRGLTKSTIPSKAQIRAKVAEASIMLFQKLPESRSSTSIGSLSPEVVAPTVGRGRGRARFITPSEPEVGQSGSQRTTRKELLKKMFEPGNSGGDEDEQLSLSSLDEALSVSKMAKDAAGLFKGGENPKWISTEEQDAFLNDVVKKLDKHLDLDAEEDFGWTHEGQVDLLDVTKTLPNPHIKITMDRPKKGGGGGKNKLSGYIMFLQHMRKKSGESRPIDINYLIANYDSYWAVSAQIISRLLCSVMLGRCDVYDASAFYLPSFFI